MLMRLGLLVFGWSLMGLGVAGLFLPILPGILLILIGLTVLSTEYHWARRLVAKLGQKHPEAHQKLQNLLNRYTKATPQTNSSSPGD
jgi:uncharacterized membrane protein YbaN (DUF454 family)